MRLDAAANEAMRKGLDEIRSSFEVSSAFPDEVLAAAGEAAKRPLGDEHADRTDIPFVTLDPAPSRDLDQAFAIEIDGDTVVLRYAIADVSWFVRPGDPLDAEAWRRGVTIYLPDAQATLYPPVLCEDAASLLPEVDRPAFVFAVHVAPDGAVALAGCERAIVRSRAKLAYESVRDDELPEGFDELSRRIVAAEDRRGAPRVEIAEQELVRREAGGWALTFRPRLASEERNAGMSLACNLAVADALHAAGTGLFRVMPEVDEGQVGRLRRAAATLSIEWPEAMSLAEFQRSLRQDDPKAVAFLRAARRAGGGATYESYREDARPWHSALQATYVHATAPLRRLADRYVIEAAHAVANGAAVPAEVDDAFARLPGVMDDAEAQASRVEHAALDLAETVLLADRVGETFAAVILDEDDRGAQIQIEDPAILARVGAHDVDPGDRITVRVAAVDVAARRIELERVA